MYNSDEEILRGLRRERQDALKQIYKIVYPSVLAYIKNNSGSEDEAQDIFQEAMIVFYQKAMNEEFKLFEKWIDRLLIGNYEETKLDYVGNYNTITDFKNLCEIDLEKKVTFEEALDYLRAMTFDGYDNAFFKANDG